MSGGAGAGWLAAGDIPNPCIRFINGFSARFCAPYLSFPVFFFLSLLFSFFSSFLVLEKSERIWTFSASSSQKGGGGNGNLFVAGYVEIYFDIFLSDGPTAYIVTGYG